MRIVLDSNVFISGFLFQGKPFEIIESCEAMVFNNFVTTSILDELQNSFSYGKFTSILKRINTTPYEITQSIEKLSTVIECEQLIDTGCRDAKDVQFLSCAVAANAEIIVSGDKHLLELNPFKNIQIITPAEFYDKHLA
jgi:uncharacterized protein